MKVFKGLSHRLRQKNFDAKRGKRTKRLNQFACKIDKKVVSTAEKPIVATENLLRDASVSNMT